MLLVKLRVNILSGTEVVWLGRIHQNKPPKTHVNSSLAVPRGCLQFVIVVLPDHTHLLV